MNAVDCGGIRYMEMPEHFQFPGGWGASKKYSLYLRETRRFSLRLLLLNNIDAKSFEDLKSIEGVFYEKFVGGAKTVGYLTDDTFYENSLQEASSFHSSPKLRDFFITLMIFEEIHNAGELWYRFVDDISKDFVHKHFPKEKADALAYNDLIDRINAMGEK